MSLRLFSKPGCHLCEDAERQLRQRGYRVELVDITLDAELMRRYGERIPVLEVDGREFDAPLTRQVLDRALSHRSQEQVE